VSLVDAESPPNTERFVYALTFSGVAIKRLAVSARLGRLTVKNVVAVALAAGAPVVSRGALNAPGRDAGLR
jgi:hypothetical protein